MTRPDVKIVISIREDYLGALEEFSPAIPNLFHERLRLEPLSEEGARDAITNPARLLAQEGEEPFWPPRFELEKPALDKMIEFLKGKSKVIEPFTLQLLCRHAEAIAHRKGEERMGPVLLTLADFNEEKDFEQVLKNFYQDVLVKLEKELGATARINAEELCEHGLLDREGRRLLLEERQISDQFGVDVATLAMLVHERLVRRERREESTFYEISHDRLAELIYASRRNKLTKNEREQLRKEKESTRQMYMVTIALLVLVSLAVITTAKCLIVYEKARNVATLLSIGRTDAAPLRERLLSLVDASESSENIGVGIALWFTLDPKLTRADELLRKILARSPIFGARAEAALDPDGARLIPLTQVRLDVVSERWRP